MSPDTGPSRVVVTSECLVPGCPFVAIENDGESNPMQAAKDVADHINEVHDADEIPEDVDEDISGLLDGDDR